MNTQKLRNCQEDQEPSTDPCREMIQEHMWWWRQLDASLCSPSVYAGVLLFHHFTVSPSSFKYVFLLSIISGTFLICHFLCPTWCGFSLFQQFFSFILLAGHYAKYCGNRMYLWYIIKDGVWTADLLAFSAVKKGGKALLLHVYFRWKLHWTEARWCSDPKDPPKPSLLLG